jgi:MFS family permease
MGSFYAQRLRESQYRRILRYNTLGLIFGSIVMVFARTVWEMILGRVLCGLFSGIALVLTPICLKTSVPSHLHGVLGVATQFSICSGILLTQLLCIPFLGRGIWKPVLSLGAIVGVMQLGAFLCGDHLLSKSYGSGYKSFVGDLSSNKISLDRSEDDGFSEHEGAADRRNRVELESLGMMSMFRSRPLRRAWISVLLLFAGQQLSGINIIVFYSTSIMKDVSAGTAPFVSVLISATNLIMTVCAAVMIERTGRRNLVLCSAAGMSVSSICLAFALNNSQTVPAVIACLVFISTFSIGLGPIPFLYGEFYRPVCKMLMVK